jgi:hypothetical protein
MRVISFDVGIKNMALLDGVYEHGKLTISAWKVINLSCDLHNNQVDMKDTVSISKCLISHLSEMFDNSNDIATVIVENQPALKNPTMKSLQVTIYTYFLCKHKDVEIKLMSPLLKVKPTKWVSKGDINVLTESINSSSPYQKRKKLSTKMAHFYLDKYGQEYMSLFLQHSKKDDMSDTLLMTLVYCDAL